MVLFIYLSECSTMFGVLVTVLIANLIFANALVRNRYVVGNNNRINNNKLYSKVLEDQLLDNINNNSIELEQRDRNINNIINQLEESPTSIADPISSTALDGCWKLLFTSSSKTNSPIQRTVTSFNGNSLVNIYQVINIINKDNSYLNKFPDVSNVVCIGDKARLRVTALASTINDPLIVPRKGDGKILGMNIFGVSSSEPPNNPSERIDFAFQEAAFEFSGSPFSIPYPVPFKLLGDEAKGWIDIIYLSEKIRIARGNKGTIFVLEKVNPEDDRVAKLAITNTKDLQNNNNSNNNSNSVSSVDGKTKIGTSSSKGKTNRIVVIFPAQLGIYDDYTELANSIRSNGNSNNRLSVYIPRLKRFDWPIGLIPSFFSSDYLKGTLKPSNTLQFYYKKIDEAVEAALRSEYYNNNNSNSDVEIVLLGHSIGGWVARAWLSGWADKKIKNRVRGVVTLGSPHNPPPKGSNFEKLDQTRGLLTYINSNYPGAYESGVRYTSVIGSEVRGSLNPTQLYPFLAYFSYIFLAGSGNTIGDGIVPVETAALPGAEEIVLPGIKHSGYIPTPLNSIKVKDAWYGSEGAIQQWIKYLSL